MYKRLLGILIITFVVHPYLAYAQSLNTRVDEFCSTLVNKDIASVHTRSLLMPFFISENDLSNFIVYMNIKMGKEGFKRTTVLGCKLKRMDTNGLNAQAEYEITGRGQIFFLKRHIIISTLWVNKDDQWYIEAPSTIDEND
jgi:hypothetical protein